MTQPMKFQTWNQGVSIAMPKLEKQAHANCRHCLMRLTPNADGTAPWHTVGIFVCEGAGKPVTNAVPAAKKVRR